MVRQIFFSTFSNVIFSFPSSRKEEKRKKEISIDIPLSFDRQLAPQIFLTLTFDIFVRKEQRFVFIVNDPRSLSQGVKKIRKQIIRTKGCTFKTRTIKVVLSRSQISGSYNSFSLGSTANLRSNSRCSFVANVIRRDRRII